MKLLIISSCKLPVPAVKGGAVPTLIEELLQQNEVEQEIEISCCSIHDIQAEIESKQYKKTKFVWAKIPRFIHFFDKTMRFIMGKIFRMKRLLSIGFVFQIAWYAYFVGKVLKNNNYDFVIFENSIPVLSALKMFGNRKKYADKYYLHMHSVPRKYFGNARLIEKCKKIICISEYVADAMLNDSRLNLTRNNISIMYNCIDTNFIKPGELCSAQKIKDKYGIDNNKKIILFVGRMCKDKGIEQVLSAVRELNDKSFVLLAVGSNFYKSEIVSPYEERLREIAEPIKDQIIFTGYIDYKIMPEFYNASDVVVLPSMWEEPAGMTIIEAMACKKPVITTYSGGIPEYTGEGNCILLKRDDSIVENISKGILDICQNKEYAVTLSNKAYERATQYDEVYYYKQLKDILFE